MFSFYVRRRNNAAFNVLRIVWTIKKAVYSRLSRYRITSDHFSLSPRDCLMLFMIPSIIPASTAQPATTRKAKQKRPAVYDTISQILITRFLLSYLSRVRHDRRPAIIMKRGHIHPDLRVFEFIEFIFLRDSSTNWSCPIV